MGRRGRRCRAAGKNPKGGDAAVSQQSGCLSPGLFLVGRGDIERFLSLRDVLGQRRGEKAKTRGYVTNGGCNYWAQGTLLSLPGRSRARSPSSLVFLRKPQLGMSRRAYKPVGVAQLSGHPEGRCACGKRIKRKVAGREIKSTLLRHSMQFTACSMRVHPKPVLRSSSRQARYGVTQHW